MIVAMFPREEDLAAALARLRASAIGPVETYTPAPLQGDPGTSPIPVVILIAGLLGGVASFGLQTFSSMVAYPFQIGGRPQFAWASFIPTAFENAVLIAIVAGFLSFMVINRMPRLYDPVDEAESLRAASGDGWCLSVRSDDPAILARARTLLRELQAARVEEVPP
jgi:hypothetical protein